MRDVIFAQLACLLNEVLFVYIWKNLPISLQTYFCVTLPKEAKANRNDITEEHILDTYLGKQQL
jgi:hypothetical protein